MFPSFFQSRRAHQGPNNVGIDPFLGLSRTLRDKLCNKANVNMGKQAAELNLRGWCLISARTFTQSAGEPQKRGNSRPHTHREVKALSHEALDLAAGGERMALTVVQHKGENLPAELRGVVQLRSLCMRS
jgi:hypothetical protein